jgi:hypothetical protein
MLLSLDFDPWPPYEESARWAAVIEQTQLLDPADSRTLVLYVKGVKPNQTVLVAASRASGMAFEAWDQDQLGDLPQRIVAALAARGISVSLRKSDP